MFLNLLKESNKDLFLKICVHASLANDVFAEEEKEVIYAYCHELNMAEHIPEDVGELDNIVKILATQADDVEKNIIILEILGLVKSDGIYDEKEKNFMQKLVNGLGIQSDVLSKYNSLLEIYTIVYKELRSAVCE